MHAVAGIPGEGYHGIAKDSGQVGKETVRTVPDKESFRESMTWRRYIRILSRNGITKKTSVYRQLERMVDEGIVNKYILDANTPACFEYVPEHAGHENEICFHAKCEKCGKLIHLNCEELTCIQEHLREHHQFTLDPLRTVFYGICEQCSIMASEE